VSKGWQHMSKRVSVPPDLLLELARAGLQPLRQGWTLGSTVLWPAVRRDDGQAVLVRWLMDADRSEELLRETVHLATVSDVDGMATWIENGPGYCCIGIPSCWGRWASTFAQAQDSVTVLLNLSDRCLHTLSDLHGRGLVHGGIHHRQSVLSRPATNCAW